MISQDEEEVQTDVKALVLKKKLSAGGDAEESWEGREW